jgi:hypothetical protein
MLSSNATKLVLANVIWLFCSCQVLYFVDYEDENRKEIRATYKVDKRKNVVWKHWNYKNEAYSKVFVLSEITYDRIFIYDEPFPSLSEFYFDSLRIDEKSELSDSFIFSIDGLNDSQSVQIQVFKSKRLTFLDTSLTNNAEVSLPTDTLMLRVVFNDEQEKLKEFVLSDFSYSTFKLKLDTTKNLVMRLPLNNSWVRDTFWIDRRSIFGEYRNRRFPYNPVKRRFFGLPKELDKKENSFKPFKLKYRYTMLILFYNFWI